MNLRYAVSIALNRPDGSVPDWIQLFPAGPIIEGVDGRAWTLPDPTALVAAFARRPAALVIDWEHATEHRAPVGLDAPAAGWIDELTVRDGAVWGHVEWTDRAAQQITAKEYRFLSPVFTYQKADARIVELISAGLTNQPNLNLTALNRAEELPMALSSALHAALELSTGADEAAAIAAIVALRQELATAKNRAETPPLDKFIPRADYDAALARAANAEQQIAALNKERRDTEIAGLVGSALQAKKIIPATKDYYVAMCQTEGGVAAFKAFLDKAPPQIGEASGLDDRKPDAGVALNAELQAVSALFGNSFEDLKKFGGLV